MGDDDVRINRDELLRILRDERQATEHVRELQDHGSKLVEELRVLRRRAYGLKVKICRLRRRMVEVPAGARAPNIDAYETTVELPAYKTSGSSGLDLRYDGDHSLFIRPNSRRYVPTGIALEIPEGYEGHVRPRSGFSLKGIDAPFGTIDSDYRGEVGVLLANASTESVTIEPGERVAQLVICPVMFVELVEVERVEHMSKTERGDRGWGSTGGR